MSTEIALQEEIVIDAATKIVKKVNENGYGFLFTHEYIHEILGLEMPDNTKSINLDEYKQYQFKVMSRMAMLWNILLEKHQIYLDNSRGKGYIAMTPEEQVTSGAKKYFNKAVHALDLSIKVLENVKAGLLNLEQNQKREMYLNNMNEIAGEMKKKRIG